MNTLQPLEGAHAVNCMPGNMSGSAWLNVYDGYPDSQDWEQDFKQRFHGGVTLRDYEQVSFISSLNTGAPFGPFIQESYRVARAVGVLFLEGVAPFEVLGACVAQGICFARYAQTSDTATLVVEFRSPQAFGWGSARASLSHEHVKARCLQQFFKQGLSLLDNLYSGITTSKIVTEFTGDWGPETARIRLNLDKVCTEHWRSLKNAGLKNPLLQ